MILPIKLSAVAISATLLAGGTAFTSALHKDVTLTVDGVSTPVQGLALTVDDVLRNSGVTLGARDLVYPSAGSSVENGQTIVVQYAKELVLDVDGTPRTLYTTATTLDSALADYRVHELADSKLSVSRSMSLPREGLTVTVTTPKRVMLHIGGKAKAVTTTATTVAELLAEKNVSMSSEDTIKPDLFASVREGTKVTLDRVEVTTRTKTESVPFTTVKRKDATLWRGETTVIRSGKTGKARRTYEITTVNGKVTRTSVLAEKTLTKSIDEVIRVGTKATSSGTGLNLARAAMWDRIARCESGGNWSINTGNGYYGGLQFSLSTWNSVGGRDFAASPNQASRAEQITVANRLYAKAGLAPWGCRHAA